MWLRIEGALYQLVRSVCENYAKNCCGNSLKPENFWNHYEQDMTLIPTKASKHCILVSFASNRTFDELVDENISQEDCEHQHTKHQVGQDPTNNRAILNETLNRRLKINFVFIKLPNGLVTHHGVDSIVRPRWILMILYSTLLAFHDSGKSVFLEIAFLNHFIYYFHHLDCNVILLLWNSVIWVLLNVSIDNCEYSLSQLFSIDNVEFFRVDKDGIFEQTWPFSVWFIKCGNNIIFLREDEIISWKDLQKPIYDFASRSCF